MKRFFPALIILTLASLACQLPGLTPLLRGQPTPVVQVQTNPPVLSAPVKPAPEEASLAALYEQVIPGVVAIRTGTSGGSGFVFDSARH
jgi:hypothetical protein